VRSAVHDLAIDTRAARPLPAAELPLAHWCCPLACRLKRYLESTSRDNRKLALLKSKKHPVQLTFRIPSLPAALAVQASVQQAPLPRQDVLLALTSGC
jgi:hypothetical protein